MLPLAHYPLPGLFITATGTDIGKTTVTAALAAALHSLRINVGILKSIASGCPINSQKTNHQPLTDDDLIPLDALLSAQSCNLDITNPALLQNISPIRYAAPASPHLAAQLEDRPINYQKIANALAYWQKNSHLLLVEAAGGWLTPIDQSHTIADLAQALNLPILLVTIPTLGSINSTLLTVESIRARNLPIAGLIINKVPPENARDLNILSNLTELPRLTNLPLLATLPQLPHEITHPLPQSLITPLLPFAKTLLPHNRLPL